MLARLPGDAGAGAAGPARPVPPDRHRQEGGRRRQRRHALVDGAADRRTAQRPAVPAGEGGRAVGAGGVHQPSEFDNCGQRVVVGQRLMQAVSDIFLGWVRVKGIDGQRRDFYLRQLRDWKGSAEIATMAPPTMSIYGELCGWTLARAHARSGIASPSPRTSARAQPSTSPSASSPRPTPTRTSGTTACWSTPSPQAASPRLRMCRTLGLRPWKSGGGSALGENHPGRVNGAPGGVTAVAAPSRAGPTTAARSRRRTPR